MSSYSGPGFTRAVVEDVSQGQAFFKCKSYLYNSFLLSAAWHIHLFGQISSFSCSYPVIHLLVLYICHQNNFGLRVTLYMNKSSVIYHLCVSIIHMSICKKSP